MATWERAAFLLLDKLASGMAVHAACLRSGSDLILLPGTSGAGKSHLALWYRSLGYKIGTDELVSFSLTGGALSVNALARPVILKGVTDLFGLARDASVRTILTSNGLLAQLANKEGWLNHGIKNLIVVRPVFESGASLKLESLTSAQVAMTLMGNCVNARNLTDGGMRIAAQVGRSASGIAVTYGETAQLNGTLDVLSRLLLRTKPHRGDLPALCAAFTAGAASSPRLVTPAAGCGARGSTPAFRPLPTPTIARFRRRLTVGMTTFDDYDGVYFTIQSIRMGHPGLAGNLEFVVIDNNPTGVCAEALANLATSVDGCRYVPRGAWSGTAMKNAVFEEASSPIVLCMDSHVLVTPGSLERLISVMEANPGCRDLVQGPMLADNLSDMSTHMEPCWSGGMYGVWGNDPRGMDPSALAFDIPMHGMGLFACRREAWAGFNPAFRGFGAEEGYIHEKTRRNGGRTICYPFLRWAHRFGRPYGVPYVNRWEDRIRNYLIGFDELGLDTNEMETHFSELLGAEVSDRIFRDIRAELKPGARIIDLG